MMTRQDFNLIETQFRERIKRNEKRETFICQNAVEHELAEFARQLANKMEHTYSNFNKAKFLRGCGL